MSGNASFADFQNLISCGRMSVPTAAGVIRSVTWLKKSSANTSYTAS